MQRNMIANKTIQQHRSGCKPGRLAPFISIIKIDVVIFIERPELVFKTHLLMVYMLIFDVVNYSVCAFW